jgi:DNA-binding MarR family transcriptional regulator
MIVSVKEKRISKQQRITDVLELERQFGDRVHPPIDRHWMSLGLTTVQLKSLFYICKTGDANSKKLSETLGVTPANVTGVIDRLIERGMVLRTESAKDRRITLLQATNKGKKLIASLDSYAIEHMSKLLSNMNEDELEYLYLGLSALIKAWDDQHKNKMID